MLDIQNVSKSFGDLPVLDDVNLTVGDREIVALIGPSGCGKSTLLNIIAGLLAPDAGKITGRDQKMSYMFQTARLLPWFTVRQNVKIVREDIPDDALDALLASVGLADFGDYYPAQLSGGMAKRCALARAFAYESSLLLMDEPFSALDYGTRLEMIDVLLAIWRQTKKSVLFVTHEIDEALTVATKIAVLSHRPSHVVDLIDLPGKEGRDAADPALAGVRKQIIEKIVK